MTFAPAVSFGFESLLLLISLFLVIGGLTGSVNWKIFGNDINFSSENMCERNLVFSTGFSMLTLVIFQWVNGLDKNEQILGIFTIFLGSVSIFYIITGDVFTEDENKDKYKPINMFFILCFFVSWLLLSLWLFKIYYS